VPVEQPSSDVVALLRLRAEFPFERERPCRNSVAAYRARRRAAGKDQPRRPRTVDTDGHIGRDWFRKNVWTRALAVARLGIKVSHTISDTPALPGSSPEVPTFRSSRRDSSTAASRPQRSTYTPCRRLRTRHLPHWHACDNLPHGAVSAAGRTAMARAERFPGTTMTRTMAHGGDWVEFYPIQAWPPRSVGTVTPKASARPSPEYGTSTTAVPPSVPAGTLHLRAPRRNRRSCRKWRTRSSTMAATLPGVPTTSLPGHGEGLDPPHMSPRAGAG
jgi:hypothetical protein